MKIKFYTFITMILIGSFAFGQTSISNCGDFADGPNTTWTDALTACTLGDGNDGAAQTFTMNVTSLPEGGANYRVVKTVANGNWNNGPAVALTLGENFKSVPGVAFDRTVKFQFSSGDVEFDFLSVNSDESSCTATSSEPATAVSNCEAFDDGPNATWTDVLTACTLGDGNNGDAQTFTMEIASLPAGGANYRVVKTVANGNWNNGSAVALTLGTNTKTVPGVAFDRTVKFQFSSGDIEFSSLTLNGEDVSCEAAAEVLGCTDSNACNYDASATVDNGTCGVTDDCGDCQIPYCYNMTTHAVTYVSQEDCSDLFISGTGGGMTNLDSSYNPYWNAGCETLTVTTTVCDGASSVAMTGPWWGWDAAAGPVASDNGDGTWTFTFTPAPTDNMEYLLVVDGVQEDLVAAGSASGDWSCTPITDYFSYANRLWTVGSGDVSNVYGTCATDCSTDEEPTTATVSFYVDMSGSEYPNSDYDNVVVNGSWNGWNGWGVTLADDDGDGIYTGDLEIDPSSSFEYVVAVTGAADGWSGWGVQFSEGCTNANASVTAGEAGSVTDSYFTVGCAEVLGCLDMNASNYNSEATEQGYDQYGNLQCVYASCDDVPGEGCIYADGFGYFNDEFGPDLCVTYGGTPCGGGCDDVDNDGICDEEDSCVGSQGSGVRYIDEVFNCVDVTSNVQYADNITVLTALQGLPPMPSSMAGDPQIMDIYTPSGDTETSRPLLIYVHTGNFLPPFLNGSAQGSKTDLHAVEICTRFARMGYVVASIEYRKGWNPLAATQEERTIQLIGAAYRGVQDCRTAVRYFRMNAAEMGNEYGIDPGKIGYFGDGTGGYATLAASTISDYNDIILDDMGAPITKFWYDPGDGSYIPMVIEEIHGDPEAKYNGYAPDGTQLCIGHYPDYSSDVQFNVNLGGALGDHNWLDHGDVPMVTFQCPHDPFAPYTTGVLIVPTTNELVVEVTGGYDIHAEINSYDAPNNNDVYQSANLDDELSQEAISNGGFDGLFPILNSYVDGVPTEPFDSSPWQWWDQDIAQAYDAANGTNVWATQMTLNPTMSEEESNYWIDIIQAYTAPRLALGLGVASAGGGCTDESACNFNALATEDDGSCTYADPGYDCDGTSLNIEGCTDAMACNFDPSATVDTGCTYLSGDGIPTGQDNVWLVGLTVTGTPFEAFGGGCEADGGVNPNLSINGIIVGDGSTPLTFAGATDPTGLLADLVDLANAASFSGCGDNMTVAALGNVIPLIGNGQFWMSPIPLPNTGGQYLWAAPMMNFNLGCGDPTACNFSGDPCELSVACTYPGCTDVNADNYNASAGCEDGSCIYLGCTDPDAPNYDPNATDDNGSCIEVVLGCTDIDASNWDPTANTDDGSCITPGCTYADANNYDASANDDDGSCEFSLGNDCVGDLNGDEVAATSDLLIFLSVFGQTCE